MIRINKIYIDRFKKTRNGYYYMIAKGIFLNFDLDLIYEGYNIMYLSPIKVIDKIVNEGINNLLNKGLLEVED